VIGRLAAVLLAAASMALPRTAEACAMCLSSAFGDRSYTWPYIGLILAPFIVGVVIVAVLAWHAGWRRQTVMDYCSAWMGRLRRVDRAALSPRTHTETT
jgi:hypothetical protein